MQKWTRYWTEQIKLESTYYVLKIKGKYIQIIEENIVSISQEIRNLSKEMEIMKKNQVDTLGQRK